MFKDKVIMLLTCLIISYIFVPIVFENILLPGIWFGLLSLYTLGLLLFSTKVFLTKQMLIVYFFAIMYSVYSTFSTNPEVTSWFTVKQIPLFVVVSLYTHYFYFSKDYRGMRFIFWFTFICILVSCITSIIGLERFPVASRELASSVRGDIEMTNFYLRLGIVGYGFISALAYYVPLIVLLLKDRNRRYRKYIFIFALFATFLTVLYAQYTTQFLLYIIALLLSFVGLTNIIRYKNIIFVLVAALLLIPFEFYSMIIKFLADFVPGTELQVRLMDIVETSEVSDINVAYTHVGGRFARIPYLLSEFVKSPIIGGGDSTGHVFWLDHLSIFGLVGMIPWLMLLIDNYYTVSNRLKDSFFYYQVAFLMFVLLGFMKGSGNREQYIILFFILPLGLFLYEKKILFWKNH